MKVAVTATGETIKSTVEPRFGRAGTFILYDTETGETEVIDNTGGFNLPQGAGIQTAELLSRRGANYVITGHCGPKAFRTLQAAEIKVITGAGGTVADVIEQFKSGKLTAAKKPDVPGHWM